jgi:hypothetical protein
LRKNKEGKLNYSSPLGAVLVLWMWMTPVAEMTSMVAVVIMAAVVIMVAIFHLLSATFVIIVAIQYFLK